MVFGRKIDDVIRCLGNEFYNEFYGWNEERNCGYEKKLKLDESVNVVYIKNREGKMMTLKRFRMANGKQRIELIIEGENIECKTQKEMVNIMLDYAIHHMGFMDKTLTSVYC